MARGDLATLWQPEARKIVILLVEHAKLLTFPFAWNPKTFGDLYKKTIQFSFVEVFITLGERDDVMWMLLNVLCSMGIKAEHNI